MESQMKFLHEIEEDLENVPYKTMGGRPQPHIKRALNSIWNECERRIWELHAKGY